MHSMTIYRVKQALGFWLFIMLACVLMGQTEEWRQERMQMIEATKSLPQQDRIPILGSIVTAGYPDRMMPPNEIQLGVAAKARAEMLAIPGHAEYYRDRILKARLEYEGDPLVGKGSALATLTTEQSYGFQILSQLPSVETVRVLGEFLADDRGKIGGPGPQPMMDGKRSIESANSTGALHAFHILPLASKPVAAKDVFADKDLETYRLWYAQIKSGNRTFRFEGDPTEYDLDGPAPPEKLRRVEANRKRNKQRDERTGPGGAEDDRTAQGQPASVAADSNAVGKSTGTLATELASGLVIAAALWYFLRLRSSRST
jgi:hypothetical protein